MRLYPTLRQLSRFHHLINENLKIKCLLNFASARKLYISPSVDQKWGKNKKHRNIKLNIYFDTMSNPDDEKILAPLRANVKEQVLSFIYKFKIPYQYVLKFLGRNSS